MFHLCQQAACLDTGMGTPQSSAMASLPRLLLLEPDDVCGTARRQPAAHLCIQTAAWGLFTKGCARLRSNPGCAQLRSSVCWRARACLD